MGRDIYELSASAALSRHHSPADDADNAAWNEFVAAVRELAQASPLSIHVHGSGDLPTRQWS